MEFLSNHAGTERLEQSIEEEILPDDEFLLLETAVATAENPTLAAISVFLTSSGLRPPYSPFLLTLRPRPRFPPSLHQVLLTYATNRAHLHEELHFNINSYGPVHDLVVACGFQFSIPHSLISIAIYLSNLFQKPTDEDSVINSLSPLVWPKLHSFQQTGVLRAICTLHGRVLFADDMGLGKTVQALAVAEYYRKHPTNSLRLPVLVMCPATLREAWKDAVLRWLPDTEPDALHVLRSAKDFDRLSASYIRNRRDPWDEAPRIEFVVAGYDLLPKIAHRKVANCNDDALPALHFPIVIADECHTLRNKDTARAQGALPFLLAADRRILISGTPVLSKPSELFPLLTVLLASADASFLSHEEYVQRYCGGEQAAIRAVTCADELYLLLSTVMVRRAKEEIRQNLPPKVRRHVLLQLPFALLHPLSQMKQDLDQVLEQIAEQNRRQKDCFDLYSRRKTLTSQLYHSTARTKIPGIVTRLQQLIRDQGHPKKILVFAHHLEVLDAVEALASRECVAYIRIDGQTNSNKRNVLVNEFQSQPSIRIGILSLAVAGTGLTLTAADLVLFAELSWVPSELRQAEDRAHRLGRVAQVTVEYLVAPGTADDMMWLSVKDKLDVVNKTIDGSNKLRKEASDVSIQSGERICISELTIETMRTEFMSSLEINFSNHSELFLS